ncbi:MAG: hypothetical protein J2O46_05730 [Nocardioides sp.]|nr:hypothetical protein [Nocardioides sp.]
MASPGRVETAAAVSGGLDRAVAGLAGQVSRALGVELASIAVLDRTSESFKMTAHVGERTDAYRNLVVQRGAGLGGLAADLSRAVRVDDYVTSNEITDDYRSIVGNEGLRGMACVPVQGPEGSTLLMYAAKRTDQPLEDRLFGRLEGLAEGAQSVIDRLRGPDASVIVDERRRLAQELHESVAQVFFTIAVTAEERQSDPEVLARIAEMARNGGSDLRRRLARLQGADTPQPAPRDLLTRREQVILELVAEGLSNHDIGRQLSLAESTVKWHVRRLMVKLEAQSRWQAVVRARELWLL